MRRAVAAPALVSMTLVLMPLLVAGPARAVSDDAMETQRCIWRCMHDDNSLGRACKSCVARKCNGPERRPQRRRRR